MLFERPLLKLPIRFSAEALEREVRALPASSWVPHPNLIPGNDAVRLVTPGGKDTDDLDGEMEPTRDLLACPNIIRIMSELRRHVGTEPPNGPRGWRGSACPHR